MRTPASLASVCSVVAHARVWPEEPVQLQRHLEHPETMAISGSTRQCALQGPGSPRSPLGFPCRGMVAGAWSFFWLVMTSASWDEVEALIARSGHLEAVVSGQQQLLQAASARCDQQQTALQATMDQNQQFMTLMQASFQQQGHDLQNKMSTVSGQTQNHQDTRALGKPSTFSGDDEDPEQPWS